MIVIKNVRNVKAVLLKLRFIFMVAVILQVHHGTDCWAARVCGVTCISDDLEIKAELDGYFVNRFIVNINHLTKQMKTNDVYVVF